MAIGQSLEHIMQLFPPPFSIQTRVSYLRTLIKKTGAEYIIAVSTGALVLLHFLLTRDAARELRKLFSLNPQYFPVIPDLLPRFEKEWEAGDIANAMITAMKAVQLGPWWIQRWIARGILCFAGTKGEEGMIKMGKTLRYDFTVVQAMARTLDRFKEVHGLEILLSGRETSPEYLKQGLEGLDEVLGRRVVLKGMGHEVLCGREMRGRPEEQWSL